MNIHTAIGVVGKYNFVIQKWEGSRWMVVFLDFDATERTANKRLVRFREHYTDDLFRMIYWDGNKAVVCAVVGYHDFDHRNIKVNEIDETGQ